MISMKRVQNKVHIWSMENTKLSKIWRQCNNLRLHRLAGCKDSIFPSCTASHSSATRGHRLSPCIVCFFGFSGISASWSSFFFFFSFFFSFSFLSPSSFPGSLITQMDPPPPCPVLPASPASPPLLLFLLNPLVCLVHQVDLPSSHLLAWCFWSSLF